MSKKRPASLTEDQKQSMVQEYVSSKIQGLNLNESYQELLQGIFAPMYARKPVLAPVDTDTFQNPMWSVYEREISISAERNKKLKDYADMSEDPLVDSALGIYSSECCQYSDEHGATVWVTANDPRIIEEAHRLFQQTEYEDYVEGIARDTAQNGDDFVGILYNFRDGVVRLRFTDPDEVTIKTDKFGRLVSYRYQENKKDIEPWNFVQYKNVGTKKSAKRGGSVYGTSILEPARRIWRQLRLMEDALVIWRLDIGTRRLVFYVDIGSLDDAEARKTVSNWERAYKKKQYINPTTGEFASRHSPLALDNHIFWPIRPTSRSRVEYIGGDSNVSAIEDVYYMKRKFAAALKIPLSYLGGDDNLGAVRTGLAMQDVFFARSCKKLQRSMIRGTLKLLFSHLRLREVPFNQREVRVNMEPISGIEEMQRIEALTAAVQLSAMMYQTGVAMGIPPQLWVPYILKDIMRISDEDILNTPVDMAQIQQLQQMQAAGGPGGPEGEGGDGNVEDRKRELTQRIQEELAKPGYGNLRRMLAADTDADLSLLIPESELIPVQANGKVSRLHKAHLQ